MTLWEIYRKARQVFDEGSETQSSYRSFDIICLAEHYLGATYEEIVVHGDREIDSSAADKFIKAVKLRSSGYPLQYILGSWEFDGLRLSVGEGVLIPREDSMTLLCEAAQRLETIKDGAEILDLCSGSGTVGLALAKRYPRACITAVELSDDAISYLEKNRASNSLSSVNIIKADVLVPPQFEDGIFDMLVANPPYIRTDEIGKLQREIGFEPIMALDGGRDGLVFYRAIAENWLQTLKPGGSIAVEIGEDQAGEVVSIFRHCGVRDIRVVKDINSLDRVVSGYRQG